MLNIKDYILKFILLLMLPIAICYASPMQRGDVGTNPPSTSTEDKYNESKPKLNVPLPSGNTKYYYNDESLDNASLSMPAKTVNKIIAFVNRGVITSNQVDEKVAEALKTFKQKGVNPPSMIDIRSRVLDQLIMQKIQLDLAARSGIKTNDIEINEAIKNIASQNKMSVDVFKASVAKQGIGFDDFRRQIQTQIILDKLKQREVDGRVTVNDDEVNRVLNSEAFKNRVDYNLSDIIIGIPEQSTADIVQQKQSLAIEAYNELKSGVPFYQVAAKYSNAPNALTGGELGWRNNAALPVQILDALKGHKALEYTSIIHLPVGFFIFKINDLKGHGSPQIVRQYHVRHILIKVNETTSDEEAYQKVLSLKAVLDKDMNNPLLESQDFIREAKQYSQDTSSINGGDLGWVSKGDTVPAFEQVMMNTPIGTISQPVHTPFGWHILEVLATRDSNLTNDREKAEIRQEIHENKASMLYTQWLRDIREMAYVKMNDN